MTLEPEKLLHNIELKLRGRTAVIGLGAAAFVVALWVVMKSYSDHPQFSSIAACGLLVGLFVLFGVGLLGRSRPDEAPERSLTQVTQYGIVIAHGLNSHKDMVQILREVSGMNRLPPPTHVVRGSAASEADFVPLTQEQSSKLIENIEDGITKMLEVAAGPVAPGRSELSESPVDKKEIDKSVLIKGKNLDG